MNDAHAMFGNASALKKNTMLIGAKLALALDADGESPCLDRLCSRLVEFRA